MSDQARFRCCLGLLTLSVLYAAFQHGGGRLVDLSTTLFVLGLATLICSMTGLQGRSSDPPAKLTNRLALLVLAYPLFQLIPLPLGLIRIASPTRAELVDGLAVITHPRLFVPLTISSSGTWAYFPRIAECVLIFIVVSKIAQHSKSHIWVLVIPVLTIAGFEALLGLLQYSQNPLPVSGTYLNKNHFAGLMEMALPFAVMWGISLLHGRRAGSISISTTLKISCLFSLALAIFAAILLSLSKMAFLSTLLALMLTGGVWIANKQSSRTKWPAVAALAVVALLVFLFLPPIELVDQFGNVVGDKTAEGRWPIWKDTLHLIASYPIFGCGGGNYGTGFLRYQTAGLHYFWSEAHNDYLQALSEFGLIGFLLVAALIGCALTRAVRALRSGGKPDVRFAALACIAGIAAILNHSFGDFNLDVPVNAMVFAWICAISASLPVLNTPAKQAPATRKFFRRGLVAIGCAAMLYACAWLMFLRFFNGDPAAEDVFCRVGICDTDSMLAVQELLHGRTPDTVPPSELLQFLRREPAAPNRWSDLADSLQKHGRTSEARYCFSRAIALGQHLPYMLFRVADFHFALGENADAVQLLARAWASDSGYADDVLRSYAEHHIPTEQVLLYGLPDQRSYYAYSRYLREQLNTVDLAKAWDWGVARGYADDTFANEYTSFLIQNNNPEAAAQAWAQYAGKRNENYPDCNRIFNGSFESDPTGSQFDWTIEQTPGANIDFDTASAHAGSRSLRTQFDGTQNLSTVGILQRVYLKPGRYRFEAYVRAKDISTNEGIAFQIANEQAPNQLSFKTQPILGSTDWSLVQHSFVVPQHAAGLIDIRLVRTPSLRFDSLIRGTLWIDDVSISPEVPERKVNLSERRKAFTRDLPLRRTPLLRSSPRAPI